MANKKKASTKALMPKGYETDNKLMGEMEKKRANILSSVEFRNGLLESQKRINYMNEFDRLQGPKKTARIGYQCKIKNERATEESKAIIKWWRTISSHLSNEI